MFRFLYAIMNEFLIIGGLIFVVWCFWPTRKDEIEDSQETPQSPKEVLSQTSKEIIAGSFLFAENFGELATNEQNLIASEVVHFCLSVADIQAHAKLPQDKRNQYGDFLTYYTLNDFILAKLNVGENQVEPYFNKMTEVLQHRMGVYGQCTSLMGEEGFPPAGSQVFAFNYFVNRIINPKVKNFKVSDVLIGKEKVSEENSDAFADPIEMMEWTTRIVPILTELHLGQVMQKI